MFPLGMLVVEITIGVGGGAGTPPPPPPPPPRAEPGDDFEVSGSRGLPTWLIQPAASSRPAHTARRARAVSVGLMGRSPSFAGWGMMRMYGRGAFQPCGYVFFASSSETEPAMITSSPCFQLTGVATLYFAVSCSESMTRSTSSKLRPVVMG